MTGLTRYVTTIGTPASASSRVEVPDLVSAASLAAKASCFSSNPVVTIGAHWPGARGLLDHRSDRGGRGHDGHELRDGGREAVQRRAEHRKQPARLGAPAAGHHGQHLRLLRQPVGRAKAGGVSPVRAALEHRVPDEGRGQAVAGEEGGLEGEQTEQRLP